MKGRHGNQVSVERQCRPECDLDLFHLLRRGDAYLLGHAALEGALDQRSDRPPDAANTGSKERLRVLVLDDLKADEQGRDVIECISGDDQPKAGLWTGGDGVVGPDLPTLHGARVSDVLSVVRPGPRRCPRGWPATRLRATRGSGRASWPRRAGR